MPRTWVVMIAACLIALQVGCSTSRTEFPAEWKRTVGNDARLASLLVTDRVEYYRVPHGEVADVPPCQATMKEDRIGSAVFQTSDGMAFIVGGPDAGNELNHFI